MDQQLIEKATEDISLIKKVIERTSGSLVSFSQLFVWWGVLLFGTYIIQIGLNYLPVFLPNLRNLVSPLFQNPLVFNQVFDFLVFLAVLFLYFRATKKTPLRGLGKHLITIWMFIFSFGLIKPLLARAFLLAFDISYPNNVFILLDFTGSSVFYFAYAFGFFCIYILTNFKISGYIAILYLLAALFHIPSNPLLYQLYNTSSESLLMGIKYGLIIFNFTRPLSLIIIGVYLNRQRIGDN